jgi:hypothetical protein
LPPGFLNGLERRAADVLMVVEPTPSQPDEAAGFEAEGARYARFEVGVDFRSPLPSRLAVWADARLATAALLVVRQAPDAAAKEGAHAAHAERR